MLESLNFTPEYLSKVVKMLYYLNAGAAAVFLLLMTISSTANNLADVNYSILMYFCTSVYIIVTLFDTIGGRKSTYKIFRCCTSAENVSNAYYILLSICGLGTFLCFIALAIGSNENVMPVTLSTSKNAIDISNGLNTAICGGHKYKDYKPWMVCLKDQYNCETDNCVLYKNNPVNFLPPITNDTNGQPQIVLPKLETKVFSSGMYVWWGTALLNFVSFVFHLIQAISSDDVRQQIITHEENNMMKVTYRQFSAIIKLTNWAYSTEYILWINDGIQPLRWMEFSLASPLIFNLLFLVNRVHDIYIITFSAIILNMVTSFGAAIDYTERVPIIIWFMIMGSIALVWQFVLLTNSYTDNISVYYNGDAKDLWAQAYHFVIVANWGVSLSYIIGGALLITHQCRRFAGCFTCKKKEYLAVGRQVEAEQQQACCCCYVKDEIKGDEKAIQMYQHEIIYILFSVAVKTFFVIQVTDGRM